MEEALKLQDLAVCIALSAIDSAGLRYEYVEDLGFFAWVGEHKPTPELENLLDAFEGANERKWRMIGYKGDAST